MMLGWRGDILGMFLLFLGVFFGILQIIVCTKKLNGISITGYPDKGRVSFLLGLFLIAISCAIYFWRPGHFAYPDVEGVETLLLLAGGLVAAILLQLLISSFAFRNSYKRLSATAGGRNLRFDLPLTNAESFEFLVEESKVPSLYLEPEPGKERLGGVLLLHEYGGSKKQMLGLGRYLVNRRYAVMLFDLDGHGENPRNAQDPQMTSLIEKAAQELASRCQGVSLAVVGYGFGGLLAIDALEKMEKVETAVAIDPIALDTCGNPTANATREVKGIEIVKSALLPPARGRNGKRISLKKLLEEMETTEPKKRGQLLVLSTSKTWFNDPEDISHFAFYVGADQVEFVDANHASIIKSPSALEKLTSFLS
ncbi:MAG: alpha/beta fold hydrolase [Actinomycetota bacterium]|nr:alpha/beta fold hydrolase [Actinomycetota bacterium]